MKRSRQGNTEGMLGLLIILLVVVLLVGLIGGPRYYRRRGTVVEREYDV